MDDDEFQHQLRDVRAVVDHLLAEEELPDSLRPPVLADAVTAYPGRSGKRMRAALVLWACGAAGETPPLRARYAALAVELFHCWTLVHDDIIDRDATRRAGPSCHVLAAEAFRQESGIGEHLARELGEAVAILAGDVQQAWAVHALLRLHDDGVPADVVMFLIRELSGWVTPALISGETLDVVFAYRSDPTEDEILEMMALKTGVLLEFAGQAGVLIAQGTPDRDVPLVRAIRRFARAAGLAFQLQDDLLGILGDEQSLGKPVGSDIREGKRTLLYLEAVARGDPRQKRMLRRVWGNPELTLEDLQAVRAIMQQTGAVENIRCRIEQYVREAKNALESFPDTPWRELLFAWLSYAVTRRA